MENIAYQKFNNNFPKTMTQNKILYPKLAMTRKGLQYYT